MNSRFDSVDKFPKRDYSQFVKGNRLVCLLLLLHVACRSYVAVVACPSYILHQNVLKDKNILDNCEYVLANLSGYGRLRTEQLNAKHVSRFFFNFRSSQTQGESVTLRSNSKNNLLHIKLGLPHRV